MNSRDFLQHIQNQRKTQQPEVNRILSELDQSQFAALRELTLLGNAIENTEKSSEAFHQISQKIREIHGFFSTHLSGEPLALCLMEVHNVSAKLNQRYQHVDALLIDKIRIFEYANKMKSELFRASLTLPVLGFLAEATNAATYEMLITTSPQKHKELFLSFLSKIPKKYPNLITEASRPLFDQYKIPTVTYANKIALFGLVAGGVTGFAVSLPGIFATSVCVGLWAITGSALGDKVGSAIDKCHAPTATDIDDEKESASFRQRGKK